MSVWESLATVVGDPDRSSNHHDRVHYECHHCGRNLTPAHKECPACGGAVSVYELD